MVSAVNSDIVQAGGILLLVALVKLDIGVEMRRAVLMFLLRYEESKDCPGFEFFK